MRSDRLKELYSKLSEDYGIRNKQKTPSQSSSKDALLPTVPFALLKQNCECYSEFKIPTNRPFSDSEKAEN